MSVVVPGEADPRDVRANARRIYSRAVALFADGSDHSIARRAAGTAFLIRVASAAVIYLSQVVLARWMGRFEFGVYVYVWTWVLLLGALVSLGLPSAAQRFIPEYIGRGDLDRLRGFLFGSRWLAFGLGTIASRYRHRAGARCSRRNLESYYFVPFILACLVPADLRGNRHPGRHRALVQLDRSRARAGLSRAAGADSAGHGRCASAGRLGHGGGRHDRGDSRGLGDVARAARSARSPAQAGNRARPAQLRTSHLVEDVAADRHGRAASISCSPIPTSWCCEAFAGPSEVAVYYAATKTLSLVAFVYFSVSAATAHRFSEYHVAGAREKLETFLANSIQWTFWPSLVGTLALLAIGKPVLALFGEGFEQGYPLMFVLAVGLLARAAVGPVERLLNMVGEQRICAMVYAAAFAFNFVLCLLLVKRFGPMGAAIATASALVLESILLFVVTKRRLGLHVFVWRR